MERKFDGLGVEGLNAVSHSQSNRNAGKEMGREKGPKHHFSTTANMRGGCC